MIKKFLIPLLALAGIIFAVVTVVKGSIPPPVTPPAVEPARAPFASFVAGSGLVEASTENVSVGSPVGAVVSKMLVQVGTSVKKGDPLFELDDRELRADLLGRDAQLSVAQAQLDRLRAGTREEQLPPARARVEEAQSQVLAAQASLDESRSQLQRAEQMTDTGAMSSEEVARRRFAVSAGDARMAQARAAVTEARAQLALLEAGTWAPDIRVAEAQVAQAKAGIDALRIELDRRTVRSPLEGTVLQRNIREGEFAPALATSTPLLVLGGTGTLHIRVDIDEHEAWRVQAGAKAVAFARGNRDISAPLTYVRTEPMVVPKKSLTGASTERVDTRVLQVIYSFSPKDASLYVGQQVDVYIEASPTRAASDATTNAPSPTTPTTK